MTLITKSLFVEYCKYPKLARWKVNNPTIYKKIRKLETKEQEESLALLGKEVEYVVKDLLEMEHLTIALDLLPHVQQHTSLQEDEESDTFESDIHLSQALSDTLQAIREHKTILYHPTFHYKDCLVRADFMVWNGTNYDLIEVKAKSGIRKDITDDGLKKPIGKIKEEYIHDISFQMYVINGVLAQHDLGQIGSISFAYLNKDYIRKGELDLHQLIRRDTAGQLSYISVLQRNKKSTLVVDDTLTSVSTIKDTIEDMKKYVVSSEPEANTAFPRAGNKYLEYFGEEKLFGTVMDVPYSNAAYVQSLYDQGYIELSDLNQEQIEGFGQFSQKFIAQYLWCKEHNQPIIEESQISQIFEGFHYPICFYDYETIGVPVPIMDMTGPYMQTVVQYSLHKYYEDGTMKHYGAVLSGLGEYRCTDVIIPDHPHAVAEEHEKSIIGHYSDIVQQLLVDIGDDINTSTFVVRNKHFENKKNEDIAQLFPELADDFLTINENTYDLMDIFSQGHYVHLACKGSKSIKKVLPVLVPDMSYDHLEVGRGDIAMYQLHQLISGFISLDVSPQLIQNLLIYCGQDTLAMVRIYQSLKSLL